MSSATVWTVPTPDGPFSVLTDPDGTVLASGWTADADAVVVRVHPSARPTGVRRTPPPRAQGAVEAVEAYYAGELDAILAVPVRQIGTPMRRQAWDALRTIPAGAPLTYTGLAAAIGAPAAVRPAAGACASNAPALYVPCHRVLRSDGTLGGFAWGLDVKRSLLARESAA